MSYAQKALTIGVISDTHGLLRPAAVESLQGVDHILHAGDVGGGNILEALRQIAPLTAIRGNVDVSGVCAALPATEALELGGVLFYLVHSLDDLDIKPEAAGVGAVISGHSHRAGIRQNGVLYLNPGSAGPRRFDLPISLATLQIVDGNLYPHIVEL
jgi:putative phosphoesterase